MAEQVTEVEMTELTEAVYDPDAKKDNMDETKEEEKEGAHVHSRLKCTTVETDELTLMSPSTKQSNDVNQKVRLYKRICAALIFLALILLAVVFALAMKLNEVQSIPNCPRGAVVDELICSRDQCENKYPSMQAAESQGKCSSYGKGWGRFENSCFFKSKERLNWQESREACQKQGGDLVVIGNERVQNFLTGHSKMLYWIGLRYSEEQQWMWINNTALTQSYWFTRQKNPVPQDSCALLNGGTPQINNWFSNSCKVISHYICQRQ